MTKVEQGVSGSGLVESKFMRVFLILISAVLIFTGTTYVPFILSDALKLDYIASISIGFVIFIVGIFLMIYLIRKKVIT
jgi:hypothetical protein